MTKPLRRSKPEARGFTELYSQKTTSNSTKLILTSGDLAATLVKSNLSLVGDLRRCVARVPCDVHLGTDGPHRGRGRRRDGGVKNDFGSSIDDRNCRKGRDEGKESRFREHLLRRGVFDSEVSVNRWRRCKI